MSLQTWFASVKAKISTNDLLMHPAHTFQIGVASVITQMQNEQDFHVLFGDFWGAKVFVLNKCLGAVLTAASTIGRSPLSKIDNPPIQPATKV